MQSYLTIEGEFQHKIEIKHSVFICSIKGIESFEEGMAFVEKVTKQYSDATHNCYALLTIDNKQKFYDANEPNGTAGQPILQVIKNNNLNNVVAVVTRYFGGIKLGGGGLISAYSKAVADTVEKSAVVKKVLCRKGQIVLEYAYLKDMMNFINQTGCILLDTQYGEKIQTLFACETVLESKINHFVASLTSGKTQIEWKDTNYYTKP